MKTIISIKFNYHEYWSYQGYLKMFLNSLLYYYKHFSIPYVGIPTNILYHSPCRGDPAGRPPPLVGNRHACSFMPALGVDYGIAPGGGYIFTKKAGISYKMS